MDVDPLAEALLGPAVEAQEVTDAARRGTDARSRDAQGARDANAPRDLDELAAPSDDEIIGRPAKVSRNTRNVILILSFLLLATLVAMTFYVMLVSGIDALGLIVLGGLLLVFYGLVNAVTYRGRDPLEALRRIDAKSAAKESRRLAEREQAKAKARAKHDSQRDSQRDSS